MRRSPKRHLASPGYPRRVSPVLLAAVGATVVAPAGPGCRTAGDLSIAAPPNYFENPPNPCIELEPETVDLGEVVLGTPPAIWVVKIGNPCEGDLEIRDLGLLDESAPFALGYPETLLVTAHSFTYLDSSFLADREGSWDAALWVESNAREVPVAQVRLLGTVVP